MGGVEASDIVKRLYPDAYRATHKRRVRPIPASEPQGSLTIGGQVGLDHRLGKCCSPAVGRSVVGYITRAKGVTVHLASCSNLKSADKERLLEAVWN